MKTNECVCTLMSLMCRYSSMMAVVFFSSSSSVRAGLVEAGGGVGAVSLFTEHTPTFQ